MSIDDQADEAKPSNSNKPDPVNFGMVIDSPVKIRSISKKSGLGKSIGTNSQNENELGRI